MSTADVLNVIAENVCQALDKNGEDRDVALDTSEAFHRVWHTDF